MKPRAVIFDLDGVLTDTAELHYQSWLRLAGELGIPFDRAANEPLRGLSRMESLEIVLALHTRQRASPVDRFAIGPASRDAACQGLGRRAAELGQRHKEELADRKNRYYEELVAKLSPADLLPGAEALLRGLRERGVVTAVASSSRNARAVVERLGIAPLLDALVDGNDIDRSKPDPQVFLLAAERLGVEPARCVVVEDAASGVEAALAAGMRVVGVGPPERVRKAQLVVASVEHLTCESVLQRPADPM